MWRSIFCYPESDFQSFSNYNKRRTKKNLNRIYKIRDKRQRDKNEVNNLSIILGKQRTHRAI